MDVEFGGNSKRRDVISVIILVTRDPLKFRLYREPLKLLVKCRKKIVAGIHYH